ncbi:MAG: hypothetical protein ACK55I_43940, partial [bacterium]
MARHQLGHVHAARDLRAHDAAVGPVHRPRPAHLHARGIHRPAVEARDLLRVRRVGPVEHRDPALI